MEVNSGWTPATRQPAPARSRRTLVGLACGVRGWSDRAVPLTLIRGEVDAEGRVEDWGLVTTSAWIGAAQVRATYRLRTAVEGRHCQYKCLRELATMSACRFSLLTSQVVFVLLADTLLGECRVRRRQQLGGGMRGRWLQTPGLTVERVAVWRQ